MKRFDYVIVGSGLAGLYCAYKASFYGEVALITRADIRESNSYYAQGGIASVTHEEDDAQLHYQDTIVAGVGLCETDMVKILVNEGPSRIKELIDNGMRFDEENGVLSLGLEGGHHFKRILHSGGDATGKQVVEFMINQILSINSIKIYQDRTLVDLLVKDNSCYGVRCWNEQLNEQETYYSNNVFLTTGGASAIYNRSTNPSTTVGDGFAIAYNAGCRLADMEFIQFHPTALYNKKDNSAFLISEAVRGEGAHLINKKGERFMLGKHELAELAPRDIVSREIYKEMLSDDRDFVFLSLKHIDSKKIEDRFPNIYNKCESLGLDLTDKIPISPAAHYTIGGIVTDENGRSNIDNLYICGELASTGVMGANRLASNSLLECLVFAHRAVEDTRSREKENKGPIFEEVFFKDNSKKQAFNDFKQQISGILTTYAGIIRSENLLISGLDAIEKEASRLPIVPNEYYSHQMTNLLILSKLIIKGALFRRESRGGHFREDYPEREDSFLCHTIQERGKEISKVPIGKLFANKHK